MVCVGDPPLSHDQYGLVSVDPSVSELDRVTWLRRIKRVLRRDLHANVVYSEIYPFVVGLLQFDNALVLDHLIATSPHTLGETHTFSIMRHDAGPNMRTPAIEREAWVLLLGFPLDYQTEHYIIKAVSCFGRLILWHRPGFKKSRVLVRVLINEVALCPFSLVIKRFTDISGLGKSWTVPVYILDGFPPVPAAVGNEDPVPPMGASPHPTQLPFLTLMQQAVHDQMIWQQQNADLAWEQPPVENQNGQIGWGQWPLEQPVSPPYQGINMRVCWVMMALL